MRPRLLAYLTLALGFCALLAAAPEEGKGKGGKGGKGGEPPKGSIDQVAAAKPTPNPAPNFTLTSPVVKEGGNLPAEFTGDGDSASPPLAWSNLPKGTQSLALVMHRTIFGRGLVRTAILIPYGIVTVAASYSWYYAWTPGTGYLANLLPEGSAPLTQQIPSLAVIVLAEVWKTTPFMALLLLAGLALIPQDLLRAAEVDGAGAWTRLTRVILPLMKPAILVALLFRTLDAFRIFDNIYVLTGGSNDTASVSILGYDNLFKAFNLGLGSAISVLVFATVAVIAFIFIKLFGASAPGAESEVR